MIYIHRYIHTYRERQVYYIYIMDMYDVYKLYANYRLGGCAIPPAM